MSPSLSFWTGKQVFVTGATGFLGSWLVRQLLKCGALVLVLVRDTDPKSELYRSGNIHKISVVNGVLEDFWVLERAINEHEVDTVFHLGAQAIVGTAHRFPLPTFEANIRGTYNLLEACRLHTDLVKRIVIASSDKAYGEQSQLPYTEEMTLTGRHPYEVSKSCADLIAQSYYHTYDLPVTIARCGNIYGGGDLNWNRIVPGIIRSLLLGERPVIRSDGTYVRDYTYVKDIVRAYMRLAECLDEKTIKGQAFNFSADSPMTVMELVAQIQKSMDCEHIEPDIQNHAKGEIRSQYLSIAKSRNLLKWEPEYVLEQALQETIQWYREFLGE